MKRLSAPQTEGLRKAVDACTEDFIIAGASEENSGPALLGPLGFFDWRLHGQLSRLIARQVLNREHFCLVSGKNKLGKAQLLLVPQGIGGTPTQLVTRLKKLGVASLAIEESGFSKDFLGKLKDNLSKEKIRWATLEWHNN